MQQIIVEPALGQELGELEGKAILCDASGRELGLFSPIPQRIQIGRMELEIPVTIAETEELRKVRTGKPLEEILSRLRD